MARSVSTVLLRLIVDSHPEILDSYEAYRHLDEFGEDLIPGLMECLSDTDPLMRKAAVGILGDLTPASNSAIPKIVELLGDSEKSVRLLAFQTLDDWFRVMPPSALPYLEKWLDGEDEYERVHALVGILSIDSSRTELLPEVWEASRSENPCVREIAQVFFGVRKKWYDVDDDDFEFLEEE